MKNATAGEKIEKALLLIADALKTGARKQDEVKLAEGLENVLRDTYAGIGNGYGSHAASNARSDFLIPLVDAKREAGKREGMGEAEELKVDVEALRKDREILETENAALRSRLESTQASWAEARQATDDARRELNEMKAALRTLTRLAAE